MRPRLIGIAGHARSGKSCAADYLRNKYNATVFTNSKPLGEIVAKIGAAPTRKNYAEVAGAIFDVLGRDLIARHWLRYIEHSCPQKLYVVEGIRYDEEIAIYKQETNFSLLGIKTNDTIRYLRSMIASDSNKDTGKSKDEFIAQKSHRNEASVDQIVKYADVVIQNDVGMSDFLSSVEAAINALLD